ncbi:MAG: hypothetical protein GAK31_03494 [Stenotrophomonas maltophilia]|uniref:Transmembrane protein n=1 Tax=Stenotrophomonas maltophilia TaxID=40324 RepID=A0A7V8FDP1_STEMA|nr:MAG: hypothetical protein GAK31_03494 [Stenotrophomonas maltophilia]
MPRIIIVIAAALLSSAASSVVNPAWAVSGPSNLSSSRYPEPRCTPPRKNTSNSSSDQSRYQRDVKDYFACVEKYVEGGNNDIKRIQEALDAAVRGARNY